MNSLFNRYVWLINTIYSAGRVTKLDIDRQWLACPLNTDHEEEYEPRSFHRHKEAIRELFGIDIRCDRKSRHMYYIADEEPLQSPAYRAWLMSTIALIGVMQSDHKFRSRILFEEVPEGYKALTPIVDAMRTETVLDVRYTAEDGAVTEFPLMPYCLKQFDGRWFVVGRTSKEGELNLYDLSRMQSVSLTRRKFKFPRSWKAERHFEGYYGVDRTADPVTVTVRLTGKAVNRVLRQPLHASQRVVEHTADHAVLSYWLAPTADFTERLHALGSAAEVLSPGTLRQQFIDDAQRQAMNYGMNLHYVGEQLSLF